MPLDGKHCGRGLSQAADNVDDVELHVLSQVGEPAGILAEVWGYSKEWRDYIILYYNHYSSLDQFISEEQKLQFNKHIHLFLILKD